MSKVSEPAFKPRLVDPCWSLPGEVDAFRQGEGQMFYAMLETAGEALERGRVDRPDEDYENAQAEFEIVKRSVCQALNYHLSPFATVAGQAEQLEHISDMVDDLVIVSAELLHSPDGPDFMLAEECCKLRRVAPLVDALCMAVEQSALISDPREDLVSRIIDLAWAADAVSGDGKLRELAKDAPPALRIANLDLCELAQPVARRLKELLATMLARRKCKAMPRLASV